LFAFLGLAALFASLMLVEDAYHYVLHLCGDRNKHYTANGHPRSGKWRAFEHKLIEARGGVCQACGGKDDLEGHHIEDFHAHPEKELDPDNVEILCGPQGHNCHLRIGHSFDYKAINPNCREDAARQRQRIKNRVYE
jgi:hypothetical protein